MGVAEAAIAAAGNQHALAGLVEVGDQRRVVLVADLGADRQLEHHVGALGTGHVATVAGRAGGGLEVLLVAVIDKGVEVLYRLDPDVAALAAVAAVRPAELDKFLAAEMDAAIAAVAGAHIDLGLVEKLHRSASKRARASTVLVCGKLPLRGRENSVVSPSARKPIFSCTRSEAVFSVKAPE